MSKVNKFGTFGGVFVPSILTILGVIMYLRLPMIIGEAGLFMTLGIIILAHVISVTTGISVSSIATDKKVEAGGTYFMISRSLGLPIGGTLGLALFVGLSFSVSLYLIGFAESFLGYWGFDVNINTIRMAGTAILVLVTTITLISTSLAIKTQYFIMAAIFLSLLSIVFGSHGFVPEVPNLRPPDSGFSFMLLFGIFFPAVTGFEAGVSMSGDLKDPKKSIPGGTIAAILVGLVVYVALALFFAFTVDKNILSGDAQVLLKISAVPELVIAGIWGATLSSALGSILGAPRILQATAVDKITPRFFSKGVGKSNEPRNALLLTFFIAETGILIGELDVIARIVSIFFITTYGFLNLSCAFEAWTSADFRPSFKAPVWVSLLGATACFLVMIQLDFIASLGATIILGLLYFFLKRRELSLSSGDAWSGVWASLVKSGLRKLTEENLQSRNWRPNLLLFTGSEERRPHLAQLGLAITGKLGLLSSFELIESSDDVLVKVAKEEKRNGNAPTYFKHQFRCANIYKSIGEITNLYGFAGIEPNTVLMEWSERKEKKDEFIELIRGFERSNFNSLFYHYDPIKKLGEAKTIDVWWSGWGRNLSLALNLLRHITATEPWRKATIRLLIIQNQAGEVDRIYQQVQRILANYRIQVVLKVHNNYADQHSKEQIITTESAKTDLTIVGIPDNNYDDLEKTYHFVNNLGHHLGTCLFINASSGFEEYSIVPDDKTLPLKDDADQPNWILPALEESRYPEIAEDVRKIDTYSEKLLNLFLEKSFTEYFNQDRKFYQQLLELVTQTAKSVAKAAELEQSYKKSEVVVRSRKYFIEQIKVKLLSYQSMDIETKYEGLENGIKWYVEKLGEDINKFPKKLTIQYDRSIFKIKPTDSFNIRWYKLSKRWAHPFSRTSVPVAVNYREVAGYFLRDNRFHFLSVLLTDFNLTTKDNLRLISDFISYCEINFQRLANNSELSQENDAVAFSKSMIERMEDLLSRNNKLLQLYEGRVRLEFRKNLSQMVHYLERIRVNDDLERKRRKKSFYKDKKEAVMDFPTAWKEGHVLGLNAVLSNAHMFDFLGYLERELQKFKIKLNQWIAKESNEPIDHIKTSLLKLMEGPIEKRQPIIPSWNVDATKLLDDFEEMSDKMVAYAKTLPDEINVNNDEQEGELSIPLSSLLIYLVEIRLAGPFYDYLETLQDKLMQSSLLIQDQANLSIFNIYNVESDDRDKLAKDIMNPLMVNIEVEQKKMSAQKTEAFDNLEQLLSDLRDSLHITTLTSNVGEFSQLIRKHKSKQISSWFGEFIGRFRRQVFNAFVSVLYSQSKGILLAERLTDANVSFSQKLLTAIDNVTPDQSILQKLPHYYTMLFSGRSSISDNFWVSRPLEEKQMKAALMRYQSGMAGMMVVLGERNSGKTALCKYFCEKNFQDEKVYHVFSRDAGSTQPDEFNAALQKATRIEGDTNEIFNALIHGSVIVIHDLELWWERSGEGGLETIRYVKNLVDNYSNKCLFIVNMNPFAYEVLKETESLDTYSLGTIRCKPFNAYELRQLILTRHKSSGLQFTMGKRVEEEMGEVVLARMFNHIFEYSHGNPGMSMNAWLCGISKYHDKTLNLATPVIPDRSVFKNLPTMWNIICLQLLLHKRMSLDKLVRVLDERRENVDEPIRAMVRLGIIKAKSMEVYGLNPYLEFLLIKVFHEKEWI